MVNLYQMFRYCGDNICNQSLFGYIYVLQMFCQMNHLTTNTLCNKIGDVRGANHQQGWALS